MKTSRFLLYAAVAAAVVACNKPEDLTESAQSKQNAFKAEMGEGLTRVSMGTDYSLTWDAQDKVSVFGPDGVNTEFTALSAGESTTLEGPAEYVIDSENTYYAVYPYSADNAIAGGVITTLIPSVVAPKAGGFPENYAVAKCTDGKTLSFYNVCGLMGFRITRNDVKTVTFSVTGENEYLAGTIKINVDHVPEPTYEVVEGTKEITLVAEGVFAAGDYYVAMLPQEFSAMTVTLYNTDGQVSEVHNLSTFTLNRSHHIAPLAVDEGEFEDTEPLMGFPAVWTYSSENFNNTTWVTNNSVPADQGRGTFSYITASEVNNKFKLDIHAADPRVAGVWPGDYWLYEVPSIIPADTRFSISFAGRVSDTGHKYWMLEYLDGEMWKPASDVMVSLETGEPVEYTHTMENADHEISGEFTVFNAMSSLKVRYRCVANWQAKGGALTARNAGTMRMVNEQNLEIKVVEQNDTDALEAVMSAHHVLLAAPANSTGTFTVKSSQAMTIESEADWFTFSPSQIPAGEETVVTVTTTTHNQAIGKNIGDLTLSTGTETIPVKIIQATEFAPLNVQWLFTQAAIDDGTAPYINTFGGLQDDAIKSNDAGDGGKFVAANLSGTGKISYVQVDKTNLGSNKATRYVGGTGHPVIEGAWPGDYWLFEAEDVNVYPAGTTLNITFETRISGTGQKYWMLECWNGTEWINAPGLELLTANVGEETVSYNFEPITTSSNSDVDVTWTLAEACQKMMFRYRCVANWNKDGALAAPNGGTCRIAGAAGTSPVFKVVVE